VREREWMVVVVLVDGVAIRKYLTICFRLYKPNIWYYWKKKKKGA